MHCHHHIITYPPLVIAQNKQKSPDEVIRVSTELVQTGVVVTDKQRRFVDGLMPEQFLLKVDGQPVTLTFFEQVTAGTVREETLSESV